MSTTTFVPATARQLWALYCITKKDYRNENLSKDEASKLIAELGSNSDNKAAVKKTSKKPTLKAQFIEYFKAHTLPDVVSSLKTALGITSLVENDPMFMKEKKQYVMRGFGCSISWLTYDGRSHKAKEIEELFRELRFKDFRNLVISAFPKKLVAELEREGNPIGALYCQDYDVNSTLYYGVTQFAKSIGVKMDYVTRLD